MRSCPLFRKYDLRFADADLEADFAKSYEAQRLKVLVGLGVGVFGSAMRLFPMLTEVEPLGPGGLGPGMSELVVRGTATAWGLMLVLIGVAKCICGRPKRPSVETALALTAAVCFVLIPFSKPRVFGNGSHVAAVGLGCPEEAMDLVSVLGLANALSMCFALRVHLLAIVLAVQFAATAFSTGTYGTAVGNNPAEQLVIMGAMDGFLVFGVYRFEVLARGEFLQRRTIRARDAQIAEESALARGMQAIAERLCDLVIRLNAELRVCQKTVAADTFFNRPVFGEAISSLVLESDVDRVAKGCADASALGVPQLVPVTIRAAGRDLDAHLVITDAGVGEASRSFIVGVGVRAPEQVPPLAHGSVKVEMPSTATTTSAASETGTCDTAAIFDGQSLHQVAELGRKEHWWLELSELQAPMPLRILGEGGYGVVVVARLHGQAVAAKMLRDRSGDGARRLGSLHNELRAIRRIRHPHIAAFVGASGDEGSGEVTLVYELILGARLDHFGQREDVGAAERVTVCQHICAAVCYLHAQRPAVVHGDLKASNVMVEAGASGPQAKLIDFGLARVLSPNSRMIGLSLAWAAPEVVLGNRAPSTSVDVFGVGWLIHTAMTGQTPYRGLAGDELVSVMRDVLNEGLAPPVDSPAGSPWREEAIELCTACLNFDPQARPSCSTVLDRLRAWGSARELPCRLGTVAASSMLRTVEWRSVADELGASCRLGPAPSAVQVDAAIRDESVVIAGVFGELGGLRADAAGEDLCRFVLDPDGLRISLCSMLVDLRSGARCPPLMSELMGVKVLSASREGLVSVRVRAYFPDASGRMSAKIVALGGAMSSVHIAL